MKPLIFEKFGGLTRAKIKEFVKGLAPHEAMALATSWNLWAMEYQRLPKGDWERWVLRAGRGGGKTHAGAKTTNMVARDREKMGKGEIGIIARTYTDGRVTLVEGPAGILKTADPDFMPLWRPGNGRGLLIWPNGVRGHVLSADQPASIRGLNAAWIWGDEFDHWPNAMDTWMYAVEPALRIGYARSIITTTPTRGSALTELEKMDGTVVTRGSTYDNPYLSQKKMSAYHRLYDGTQAGLQEMMGEILDDDGLLLWVLDTIHRNRKPEAPDLSRIVVSIDPAGSVNKDSDMTGIVVVGRDLDGHAYVLEDATMKGKPHQWALEAIRLFRTYRADRIVAEVNYGGDMVENTIRAIDRDIPYTSVHATRGKLLRAEPVSALYEQGLVHHIGIFEELEKEMCGWKPGRKSPDRMDALVWAITDLLLDEEQIWPITAYC